MKTRLLVSVVVTAIITVSFFSCKEEGESCEPMTVYLDLPATPYQYPFSSAFNDYIPTLGRVLFYDTHLSVNNTVSCGSCHKQSLAFSDSKAFSRGFENNLTTRNTLPIQNLNNSNFFGFGFSPKLFWDGREAFLGNMVLRPIVNHVEMGMNDMNAIVKRVKERPYYGKLFTDAFGTDEVTLVKIAQALSSFTGSISSFSTKFDKHQQGTAQLTGMELHGKDLFFNKYDCNSCHQTQEFNGYELGGGFVNIGLDFNYADNGLGQLTGNAAENGKFKIPNLRNIALTGPYMHDGRFATLNQVLDHYSNGLMNHPNLDSRLLDGNNQPKQMNISTQEKTAIIAFLNTLTDHSMITDPKFSNPFKIR